MSRGKRYDNDKKLNVKKVIAVIIALVVIVMFTVMLTKLLEKKEKTTEKSFILGYYSIYENEKWGVIDTKGNVIIEPTYDEMIVIPDNTKPVFVCQYDVDYDNNTFKTKVINEKNETLFTNYEKVEVISNYDKYNSLWYEKSALKVQKDGKYGLINLSGNEVLKCEYDSINPIIGTSNSLITVKDGKRGLVDNSGTVIIENSYKDIKSLTNKYENGFIVENDENKYGVINYNKSVALETIYDDIKNIYGNNMYVVQENSNWSIINSKGEKYLEGEAANVQAIHSDNVIIKENEKYKLINISGEEKIPAEYDSLEYAFLDYYIARKDGQYGIINTSNEVKLEFTYRYVQYSSDEDFIIAQKEEYTSELLDREFNVKVTGIISEINKEKNYIKVRTGDDYKYYNFKLEEKTNIEILSGNTLFLSKKDGKYGYVNNQGIVVVDYKYDDATEQNKYGYVSVNKDGKWGCLNQKGEVVVEPIYELTNNSYVNFINKWHLGEDINANYYTK